MSEVTIEQRAAVEWLHATLKNRMLKNFAETLLAALPDALTNPQVVLPEEHGEYHDATGHLWWLDSDGWHTQTGSWYEGQARECAPFTRLIPERPEPSSDEIQEAWDVSHDTDESIPREFDGRILAADAYFAGYKAGAKR